MRILFEVIFDIAYLLTAMILGISMVRTSPKGSPRRLFGATAMVLSGGDAFHLIPRVYAMLTTGLENHVEALGFGTFVASISMTLFYVMVYYIWRRYYNVEGRQNLTYTVWGLAAARIGLCLLPQNQWLSANPPLSYSALRNLPFAILGVLIIVLFYQKTKETGDPTFRYMPLAVTLSFAFYLPVVFFAHRFPPIGALMIPKTLAYVWIVLMGYRLPQDAPATLQPQP